MVQSQLNVAKDEIRTLSGYYSTKENDFKDSLKRRTAEKRELKGLVKDLEMKNQNLVGEIAKLKIVLAEEQNKSKRTSDEETQIVLRNVVVQEPPNQNNKRPRNDYDQHLNKNDSSSNNSCITTVDDNIDYDSGDAASNMILELINNEQEGSMMVA